MAKIVSMSSGAIDPINVTKRVFWRPETSTKVLKVGQPVCYNSDSILDHKERSVDPTHIGLTAHTYAEGAQDKIGRLFVVEEPLTANLMSFAGICKSLGPKAGADGDMIEIFTPVAGAVVPVWTDQNCVLDRTILGIATGTDDVTKPYIAIGVAKETINRGTAGLCWMEFKNFIGDNAARLQVDDSNTNAVMVNHVCVEFLQTAGQCTALFVEASVGSAGNPDSYDYGLAGYFQATYRDGSKIGSATVVGVWMNIDSGALTVDGGHISAIQAGIYQAGDDPFDQDQVSLAALQLNLQIEDDPGNGCLSYIRMRNDGTHAIDGIFSFPNKANCGYANSSATVSGTIPFLIGSTQFFIIVSTTA